MRINRLLIIGFALIFFSTCRKKDATPPPPTPSVPGCASALAPANGAFVTTTSVQLSWSTGKIEPSDESIAHFHDLFVTQWEKFRKDAATVNLNNLFEDLNDTDKQL